MGTERTQSPPPPADSEGFGVRARDPAEERDRTWPIRVGRLWGWILLLTYIVPLAFDWRSDGIEWILIWDLIEKRAGMNTYEHVMLLLPGVLGLLGVLTARLWSGGFQALAFFVVGVACLTMHLDLEAGRTALTAMTAEIGPTPLRLITFVSGLILLAATNHVARRNPRARFARRMLLLGALAVLLSLLPAGGDGYGTDLFSSDALAITWPAAIWAVLLLATVGLSLVGALSSSLLPMTGAWVSRLLRVAAIGLPIVLLGCHLLRIAELQRLFPNGSSVQLESLARLAQFTLWTLARGYGMVILTAAGLALILERSAPRDDHAWERAF